MAFYETHYRLDDKAEELYYKMFFGKGIFLDIGCSVGNVVVHNKCSWGLDVNKKQIEIAKKRRLNAIEYDINKRLPFVDNKRGLCLQEFDWLCMQ